MLNGWQTTGIVNLCSGGAFSPTSGRDHSFSGAPNNDTADQISAHAARLAGVGPLQQRFNTAAYTPNALGTFGTAGRNSLRGPAAWNVDFGLSKEPVSWNGCGPSFAFGNPVANQSNRSFRAVQSAAAASVHQIAAKFML